MNVIIISLQFRVAHIAHLLASYYQMEELGFSPQLLVHPDLVKYLPSEINVVSKVKDIANPSIAIFWFPALSNLKLMLTLKIKFKTRIIYVLHEPLEKMGAYREAGLSDKEIFGVYSRYFVIQSFLALSDFIILPSKKAYQLYRSSFSRFFNKHYGHIPLLFADQSKAYSNKDRQYFSYIGTIATDHAFSEFAEFLKKANSDENFPKSIKFMIATRNVVERDKTIDLMVKNGRLKVIDSHPLTEDEINECYSESFGVWNAYHRTTQSGVLAKACMFGTPALVLRKNLSEFSIENKNVVAITRNDNYDEIMRAVISLKNNFNSYSTESRKIFDAIFNYRVHNDSMNKIIHELLF